MDFKLFEGRIKPPEFNVNDILMDQREVIRFKNKVYPMAVDIEMTTNFNISEIQALLLIYIKFVPKAATDSRKGLELNLFKNIFFKIFGMTNSFFLRKMFSVFDLNQDQIVTMNEWIIGLSVLLKGSIDEKIAYAFDVYSDRSAFISHDAVVNALRQTLIKAPEGIRVEEFIRDVAFIVMRKLDVDRDGQVSLDDFHQTVEQHPLMLQCLGPCLPSNKAVGAFLATFTPYGQHHSVEQGSHHDL